MELFLEAFDIDRPRPRRSDHGQPADARRTATPWWSSVDGARHDARRRDHGSARSSSTCSATPPSSPSATQIVEVASARRQGGETGQREPDHAPRAPSPLLILRFAVTDTGIGMTRGAGRAALRRLSPGRRSPPRGSAAPVSGWRSAALLPDDGRRHHRRKCPAQGSTFTVTLPAERCVDRPKSPSRARPRIRPHHAPLTEHPRSRHRRRPGRPRSAAAPPKPRASGSSPRPAARRGCGWRAATTDVITLDVLMPGMDGWAVLGALKGDPVTADIPVVMMTMIDDNDLGYALGAADYLTKPIDRERLLGALRKHVRRDDPAAGARSSSRTTPPRARCCGGCSSAKGWTVDEAANGRVGLERVAGAPPDLILLDLMMPELDGFGFVERLRAEPGLAHDPGPGRHGQRPHRGGASAPERLGRAGAPEGRVLPRRAPRRRCGRCREPCRRDGHARPAHEAD